MREPLDHDARRLGDFLIHQRREIMAQWETEVRRLRPAALLSRPVLLDHVPDFLDQLARFVSDARELHDAAALPKDFPAIHALERLDLGYDLSEVVAEYAILRECIATLAQGAGSPALLSAELPRLHRAIDFAIGASVLRYHSARERTLRALDRISAAALNKANPEAFLHETLGALLETTPSIDSASILLEEGGVLRVKAAAGLALTPDVAPSVAPGECVAGTIWKTGEAITIRDAETDGRVTSDLIRRRGTHALFGAPLRLSDEVIGVALIGSLSTYEFSHEDLLLFRTAVHRVSALVAQARKDEAIARQTALHESVVSALGDVGEGYAILEDERLVVVNDALCRMLGRTVEELLALRSVLDLIAPEQRETFAAAARERLAGGERIETAFLHRDGRRVEVEVGLKRKPTERVVMVVHDVSRQKQGEKELRSALAFRDQILNILAHDLRQPLSVIAAGAQLMLRRDAGGPDAPMLTRQLNNVQRMDRLIRDLLDYARVQRGQGIPVNRRYADLQEILKLPVASLELLHPDRKFRLSVHGECSGEFDPDRMQQVSANLLGNAVTYSPRGTPIDIDLRGEDGAVVCSIHNLGEPIPRDRIGTLFEPFRRGTSSANPQGLGLGLFIVERLVSAHGGKVSVESDASGTTFTVSLPKQS